MERGLARKSNNFRPKRTEVVWHTRREEVMKEIGTILNVNNATTETPGWFAARTPAIKNLINNMTEDELNALNVEVERYSKKGYDEPQKRR
jgi:hypothetical protein